MKNINVFHPRKTRMIIATLKKLFETTVEIYHACSQINLQKMNLTINKVLSTLIKTFWTKLKTSNNQPVVNSVNNFNNRDKATST